MSAAPKTLLLGADGFIGRHIAFDLRARGHEVICVARRGRALRQMGFEVIEIDLTHPSATQPAFWQTHLQGAAHVVNAAGILTGSDARFQAVHVDAAAAIYEAMPDGCTGLLISAVGIDDADTSFARYRRDGEALAGRFGLTILRPGMVLADGAYGGSALARGLAAFPMMIPVVGGGTQMFNPIHAGDLATVVASCLKAAPTSGPHDIGGTERVTQAQMLRQLRARMGLRPVPLVTLPTWLTQLAGRLGDFFKFGPISTVATAQLQSGIEADERELLSQLNQANWPRGFSEFLNARPAGTQELWHARLYLFKPALRLTLIFMWVLSGFLGLFLPTNYFLPDMSPTWVPDHWLVIIARVSGVLDLAIALALARAWRLKLIGWLQLTVVGGYTIGITSLAPDLWLLPLGGLMKNIPILMLLWLFLVLEEER